MSSNEACKSIYYRARSSSSYFLGHFPSFIASFTQNDTSLSWKNYNKQSFRCMFFEKEFIYNQNVNNISTRLKLVCQDNFVGEYFRPVLLGLQCLNRS